MSGDLAAVGNLRFPACVIAGYCSDMESVMKKKTAVTLFMGWLFLLSGCADRAAQIQMTALSVLTGKAEAVFRVRNGWTEEIIQKARQAEYVVVYEYEDIYLSVSLPCTWRFQIKTAGDMEKEKGTAVCAITFWPEAFPDTVVELGYHQRFGICGTGVTTERMELPDGRTGWRYSEIMNTEQMLWLTIVFDRPEESEETGTYVLMASLELSVWEQIEPEFEGILESVRMENPADG